MLEFRRHPDTAETPLIFTDFLATGTAFLVWTVVAEQLDLLKPFIRVDDDGLRIEALEIDIL